MQARRNLASVRRRAAYLVLRTSSVKFPFSIIDRVETGVVNLS